MNLISILGSPAFQLVLGVVFLITGISDGLYVFIASGLVFTITAIYSGFRNIHKL